MGTLLIAAALLCQGPAANPPAAGASARSWRDEKRCGVNALYGYLAIRDPRVQLADIERLVHPGPSGTSLWQLREAAGRLGHPCTIVRAKPEQLSRFALPAVAHYSGVRDGHFVVLVGVRPKTVIISDMTTCHIEELAIDEFKKLWSGYLLVQKPRTATLGGVLTWGGLATLAVCAGSLFYRPARGATPRAGVSPGEL